ncbi:MAG: major facilitator superfamily 1, partial [Anaeromyxobacteraceae bacterium]|nr:major facilitator superfamily 1 [Anaeromyxobacteraceae bacterium]
RPVLLLSIAMTALAFLLYGVAATFVVLLVSRLFAGAATANIAIAQAYVADVTTPEGRAKGMGMIGAAFGLGFVFGPAVGGLLAGYSLSAPGLAAAALSLLNLVGAYFLLPEPAQHVAATRSRGRFEALREEFRKPGIRRILFIYLVVTLAFSAMEATYAFLAHRHFGLADRHVSWLFTYIGVIVVLVQGGLIGPLTRRFGEKRLLVVGTILQGVGLAALPFASGVTGLLMASAPLAFGSGLSSPSIMSLLSRYSRAEDQGGTLGIGQSASALGRIVGPLAGTTSFAAWQAAPYLGGAALMVVGAAVGATVSVPNPGDGPARGAVKTAS